MYDLLHLLHGTGYKGEDAHRVWSAIYDQSALKEAAVAVAAAHADGIAAAEVPREQEVLYRLISGMHTAITTSIVHGFYNETTGVCCSFFSSLFNFQV